MAPQAALPRQAWRADAVSRSRQRQADHGSSWRRYLWSKGRIQVGVGEARCRKNNSSVSVHVAGPRGPADTAMALMGLHFVHTCRNVTHLCFDILLPDSRLAEKTIDIATQVCAIAVVFLVPQEILSSYHFFHLNSS